MPLPSQTEEAYRFLLQAHLSRKGMAYLVYFLPYLFCSMLPKDSNCPEAPSPVRSIRPRFPSPIDPGVTEPEGPLPPLMALLRAFERRNFAIIPHIICLPP